MRYEDFLDRAVYEVITEQLLLADRFNPDGSPVRVRIYRHKKSQAAYQVDSTNGCYRESKHVLGQYGEWKKLIP